MHSQGPERLAVTIGRSRYIQQLIPLQTQARKPGTKGGLSDKDVGTLEGGRRKLIKERDYIVNNVKCMRQSIVRNLKKECAAQDD